MDDVGTSWRSHGRVREYILVAEGPSFKAALGHRLVEAADLQKFPRWSEMRGFEVILEPGDALYIPSFWLHYIVSLGNLTSSVAWSGHWRVARGRKCLWPKYTPSTRRRLGQLHAIAQLQWETTRIGQQRSNVIVSPSTQPYYAAYASATSTFWVHRAPLVLVRDDNH